MTPDQRLKLAQALLTEAVVCSDKNDIDEARHLTQLAIRHEFKEEMQRIIKGDVALFKMTFKKMYSQNIKEKIVARVMLDILIEDKDFQKTFRDKYVHVAHELWIFEKQQEWKYNG